jgi:glycogen operon protein
MAPRLCASPDLFKRRGRKPWASVNFITSHDGFTLNDLVTYNEKHNEANGEDNHDGTSNNRSWNSGVEGPSDDPEITALRQRQMRNMLATLLLSQGTPMLTAGDEVARTQQGNNNAYCQDTEISWVNWDVPESGQQLNRFVQTLTWLRHRYPILRRERFLAGEFNEALGVKDVTWINATGAEMSEEGWTDTNMRCFGMLMDGRAQSTGIGRRGEDATMLMVLNAWHDLVKFTLPQHPGGMSWSRLIDTNIPDDKPGSVAFPFGEVYGVTARSLLLFVLESSP